MASISYAKADGKGLFFSGVPDKSGGSRPAMNVAESRCSHSPLTIGQQEEIYMFTALFGSVEVGVIYAIMALGVYLSFRILDFPDLTVDGSFVTGGATAAVLIISGVNPFLATIAALAAGFLAGCVTGILHTKGKINPLLSGILMMIALYSINLRIMDKPNVPLLSEETVITKIASWWQGIGFDSMMQSLFTSIGLGDYIPSTWGIFIVMFIIAFAIKKMVDLFLKTEIGLSLRAVGDNDGMVRSFSANTD